MMKHEHSAIQALGSHIGASFELSENECVDRTERAIQALGNYTNTSFDSPSETRCNDLNERASRALDIVVKRLTR